MTSTEATPFAGDVVEQVFADATTRLARARGRLRRSVDAQDLDRRVGLSVSAFLEARLHEVSTVDDAYARDFRSVELKPYQAGLEYMRLLELLGSHISNRIRLVWIPAEQRTPRQEALIELHAHATVVTAEVRVLIANGYPSGASARWRTLHELVVTARLLGGRGQNLSRRYLDSLDVDNWSQIVSGAALGPASRRSAFERAVAREAQTKSDTAITRHGPELARPNGWARPVVKTGRITFQRMEEAARAKRRRPAYKRASQTVHSGRRGSVRALIDYRYADGHYVGARFTDLARPGMMTIWGLDEILAILLDDCRRAGADEAGIWDECHVELAGHADHALRSAGITVALSMDDHETITDLTPSVRANLLRMMRDVESPER